jgi:hypothetical protein
MTHIHHFFYHYQCIDVDLDKCPGAPTDATTASPTKAPTEAPTDAPTIFVTKTSNCQFADGKPGIKCDGKDACAGIRDLSTIGCGSCNGVEACYFSNGGVYTDKVSVGENSCNGPFACPDHINYVLQRGGNFVTGKGSW